MTSPIREMQRRHKREIRLLRGTLLENFAARVQTLLVAASIHHPDPTIRAALERARQQAADLVGETPVPKPEVPASAEPQPASMSASPVEVVTPEPVPVETPKVATWPQFCDACHRSIVEPEPYLQSTIDGETFTRHDPHCAVKEKRDGD